MNLMLALSGHCTFTVLVHVPVVTCADLENVTFNCSRSTGIVGEVNIVYSFIFFVVVVFNPSSPIDPYYYRATLSLD